MNCVEQAGHWISRLPGRRFIRRLRWQPGHSTSTRGTWGLRVKKELHEPHFKSAGRWPTPATSTVGQDGQESFSCSHFRRVAAWSTRTRALHSVQLISPRPLGKSPPHFGHDRGGGATLDSTLSASDTVSLLFRVKHQLLRDEVPRNVEGQSKFIRKTGNELFCADLIS